MAGIAEMKGVTRNNVYLVPPEIILVDEQENGRRFEAEGSSLDDLVASIVENGQLQPIICRRAEKGIQVVAGYRRLAAIKQINEMGLAAEDGKDGGPLKVKVLMRECDDPEALELNVTENLDRGDLSPIDKAYGMSRLTRMGRQQKEVAKLFRVSEATVSRHLALLELPVKIQKKIHAGALPLSTAYEMARIATSEGMDDGQKDTAMEELEAGTMETTPAKAVEKSKAKRKEKAKQSREQTDGTGEAKPRALKEIKLFVRERVEELAEDDETPMAKLYRSLAEWVEGGISDRALKTRIKGLFE